MKFVVNCVLYWFKKLKKKKNSRSWAKQHRKTYYERNNPVDWNKGKCSICNFWLGVNAKGVDAKPSEMSCLDFVIRKEHKFLRNVLSEAELKKSESISDFFRMFFSSVLIRMFSLSLLRFPSCQKVVWAV